MGLPPQLTDEQRKQALLKAANSRKRRAEIKFKMKNGEIAIDDILLLAKTEDAIAKMRVKELLGSLSGVGKVRAQSLMERLNICLLYTSPSPRDRTRSRMPSSA